MFFEQGCESNFHLNVKYRTLHLHPVTTQHLSASSSQPVTDYPLPAAPAQRQEARGCSGHLTQAAAVDAQVLKGSFFSQRKIIIIKTGNIGIRLCESPRRGELMDSLHSYCVTGRKWLLIWEIFLHVGPFAVCVITLRRAPHDPLHSSVLVWKSHMRARR